MARGWSRGAAVGAALSAGFVALVALRFHGFSLAAWHEMLDGSPAPEVLLGAPRGIRTDDWWVHLPLALSQGAQEPPFPLVNRDVGLGQSALVPLALPVAHPVTLFRPELWGFFLGGDVGLAWLWWGRVLGLFGVWLAVFARLAPGRLLLAASGAALLTASPFFQFWSLNAAPMTTALGLAVLASMSLAKARGGLAIAASAAGLGAAGACFVLALYPPYQVVLAWLYLALVGGWLLAEREALPLGERPGLRLLGLAAASLLPIAAGLCFASSAGEAIEAMRHTAYPGVRVETGGERALYELANASLGAPLFVTAWEPLGNLCEAASFLWMGPVVVACAALRRLRREEPVDPVLGAVALYAGALAVYVLAGLEPLVQPARRRRLGLPGGEPGGAAHPRARRRRGRAQHLDRVRPGRAREPVPGPRRALPERHAARSPAGALAAPRPFGRRREGLRPLRLGRLRASTTPEAPLPEACRRRLRGAREPRLAGLPQPRRDPRGPHGGEPPHGGERSGALRAPLGAAPSREHRRPHLLRGRARGPPRRRTLGQLGPPRRPGSRARPRRPREAASTRSGRPGTVRYGGRGSVCIDSLDRAGRSAGRLRASSRDPNARRGAAHALENDLDARGADPAASFGSHGRIRPKRRGLLSDAVSDSGFQRRGRPGERAAGSPARGRTAPSGELPARDRHDAQRCSLEAGWHGAGCAIVFAGNGYALVAPDYPGLGESAGRHTYYVADAIGPAVVAMIEAAERLEGVPSAPVFLSGFSEGGWASLAALRILENEGRQVLGSAQVAGAYDLRRVSLLTAMKGGAPSHSLYLAYAAWGQAAYYGHRLDSVLTPEFARLVERLFAGATPREIVAALPEDPRRMFNQSFLDAFDHGGSHWLLDAFAANSLLDVTPRAPVRLYNGSKDLDVAPEEVLAASRAMRTRGADVTDVDVGPVGHDPSMLAAAPLILTWLGELEAAAK